MPLTVKLSRKFYEKFGDDIADELVSILNAVDATYRVELREQNEANFSRFEAKLREAIAELRADLIRWMFLFWIGTMGTMVGVVFAVVSMLR